jgi:hypothetical protein
MGLNRRYYAIDFWPSEVGKGRLSEDVSVPGVRLTEETVRRGRWFRVPLTGADARLTGIPVFDFAALGVDTVHMVGVDVSTSWLHTQSAVLMDPLEAWLEGNSYKADTKALAQAMYDDGELELPDGRDHPDLEKAVNTASMMDHYGGKRIARGLKDDGLNLGSEKNVRRLLGDPRIRMHQVRAIWKSRCEMVVEKAWNDDPYAGVKFNAPLMARLSA